VEEVVVTTLEQLPKNTTHWSRKSMAEHSGLSKSTVGRIWRTPSSCRRTVVHQKVYDVVGPCFNPPEGAVVLSVDEKSQIQALDRSQPVLPIMAGHARAAHPRLCSQRPDHAVRRLRRRYG
jgi:hypothetical protein